MGALFLVRDKGTLPKALAAANALLQRASAPSAEISANVLGVWIRADLDEGLPNILDAGDDGHVAVRESFSLRGEWSVCWISGGPPSNGSSGSEWVLERLVNRATTGERDVFLPVFPSEMRKDSVAEAMARLRVQYAGLVGDAWFEWNPKQGLKPGRETSK